MHEFLENAKLYLKIQGKMGIVGSKNLQVSVNKIKELSEYFHVKVRLEYGESKDLAYNYFYHLSIDGVDFIAVSDWEAAFEQNLLEINFKEGIEVWG